MLPDELEAPRRRGMPVGFWIFIILLSTLLLVKWSVAGLVEVRGQSMEPTIASGSTCMVFKVGPVDVLGFRIAERPLRVDDLVVAKIKRSPSDQSSQVIKRVTAVAGQALAPKPWLNRFRLTKSAKGKPLRLPGVSCSEEGCKIRPEHVFLLSDDLKGSLDSRQFGAVHERNIVGRIGACF